MIKRISLTLCLLILSTLPFTPVFAQGHNNAPAPIGSDCEQRGCFTSPSQGSVCIYFPCGPNNTVDFRRGPEGIASRATIRSVSGRCTRCVQTQCDDATRIIRENHETYERAIMRGFSFELDKHREWLLEEFFRKQVLKALMQMTEQLSAVAMSQTMMFGQFLDAKSQLETQRIHQELQVAAHRDYQPSEDFCWFGTNARSLADTEEKTRYNVAALAGAQISRHLGTAHTAGAESRDRDRAARWDHFTETYCDPKNNNFIRSSTGLELACTSVVPPDPLRTNMDIDYGRLIDQPRTLNVDFTDSVAATGKQDFRFQNKNNEADEEDVLALSSNLYGHDVLTRKASKKLLQYKEYQHLYLSLRSVAAKRSVAEHSYNSIVALKAKGRDEMSNGANSPNTQIYLEAVLAELGISNQPGADGKSEAEKLLGTNPSYYAQLEILAKMIYQNPDFYANLYDKPANIARKSAALSAIERMLDQALLESQLRQEMATSVLLSSKLAKHTEAVNRDLRTPNQLK